MLPKKENRASPRPVHRLEVITPDGRVHLFPRLSWLERLQMLLWRHAGTAAISTTVLTLIYAAGMAAQALDGSVLETCDQPRPPSTS